MQPRLRPQDGVRDQRHLDRQLADAAHVAVAVDHEGQHLAVDQPGEVDDAVAHAADVLVAVQLDQAARQHPVDADRVADDQRGRQRDAFGLHLGDPGGGVADVHHRRRVDLLGARQVDQELDPGVGGPGVEDALLLEQLAQPLGADLHPFDLEVRRLEAPRVEGREHLGETLRQLRAVVRQVVGQLGRLARRAAGRPGRSRAACSHSSTSALTSAITWSKSSLIRGWAVVVTVSPPPSAFQNHLRVEMAGRGDAALGEIDLVVFGVEMVGQAVEVGHDQGHQVGPALRRRSPPGRRRGSGRCAARGAAG